MADRIYRWTLPLYLTNGKLVGTRNEGGSAFLGDDDESETAKAIREHCEKEQGEAKPKKEKNTNK